MSSWMADLATRVGERWLGALALPGVVYLAAAAAAGMLGHRHAFDLERLVVGVDGIASALSPASTGTALVAAAGTVLAGTAVAYAARGVGSLVESGWFLRERPWLPRVFSGVKRLPDLRESLLVRCHLDLATVWPPLWMHIGEGDRQEIVNARSAVRDGFIRIGWGLLYLVLGAVWWPMLAVGALMLWEGHRRAAAAMGDFTRTVAAVVQVHTAELAARLGLDESRTLDADLGERLTVFLHSNVVLEPIEPPDRAK